MASIHERYGDLQERYERECEEHIRTVGLLRDVLNGVIPADRVVVSDDNNWRVIPIDAAHDGLLTPSRNGG